MMIKHIPNEDIYILEIHNELRINYTKNFYSGCRNLDKYEEDYIVVSLK